MHSKYRYDDSPPPMSSARTPISRKDIITYQHEPSKRTFYLSKKTRHGFMVFSMAVLTFALLAWYYVTQHGRMSVVSIGPMYFDPIGSKLQLRDAEDNIIFKDKLGIGLPLGVKPVDCMRENKDVNTVCIQWMNVTLHDETPVVEMVIEYVSQSNDIKCVNVEWTALRLDFSPQDCFILNDSHWYGGSEVYYQHWLLENLRIPMQPYVSRDISVEKDAFGSVLERYWLSSRGVAVVVDKDTPLHVSINQKQMKNEVCLKGEYTNSPYRHPNRKYAYAPLHYTVCTGQNVKKVHDYVLQNYFKKPPYEPDERMFRYPIWSTWARYKKNVNQSAVLKYAQEIQKYGFPNSQIEIGDMYMSFHGEADFARAKFPNATQMIRELHTMGFRVTVWSNPFANIDSPTFHEGVKNNYWMNGPGERVPALMKWWNGVAAILDVSNEQATEWFINRSREMQREYGVDSFKFDGGEVSYVPRCYNASVSFHDPNLYCTKFVETVAKINRQVEVRCAHQTQHQPIFVRMMDKDPTWNYNNGLLTMIPTALLMGVLGYPFILPYMIGDSGFTDNDFHNINKPERELYIRWMELTAYLPAMQFSIAPWQYDEEVVNISREMVRIHEEVYNKLVRPLLADAITKGYPIIRPLWWIAPSDETALSIDSEFLIGDTFLVAPVLKKHALERDIYLPQGLWKESLDQQRLLKGPVWLRNYAVRLHEVATFTITESTP
ncbi:myogenesis-regulating glycosidase-like [Asterias amurensis]|uniref:myogenesis-regulating glycosidase-like n=1 Tax=Asterias amurensis TaxID=7602 RepID=UPI003AB5B642